MLLIKKLMSCVTLDIKKDNLSKNCSCNVLTYNVVIPSRWLFEKNQIINSKNIYLTNFHKVCRHAL